MENIKGNRDLCWDVQRLFPYTIYHDNTNISLVWVQINIY